ncbi:DUF4132 domain-containing protein [Brevibacillus laterosporus]|uniref:DUF4132 domain-containing protein n=1 Tax=Brevibacillus laterosporus TaxID=1465 RepID=UPI00036B2DCA|nr:DUF4132 domain-containing protein [Brevibacillus laterosporus]ATO48365.1 hypothetical protein BrL25_04130 [Brevibacillus laterosporus DSM 25]MED2002172.1 DUF4132 domain-containing protein [Brevibacillus laterosporus]
MVLKKMASNPLISQFADKFVKDYSGHYSRQNPQNYSIDSNQYNQIIAYVSGESDIFPSILVHPKVYAYDCMSQLEKMGKKGTDETFFRAAAVLFKTSSNENHRSNVLQICIGHFVKTIKLSQVIKDVEEQKQIAIRQLCDTKKYIGDAAISFYVDTLIKNYVSSLKNSYSVTDSAVPLLLTLNYLSLVDSGYLEQIKDQIPPFMYYLLTDNVEGLQQEISTAIETLASVTLAKRDCTSAIYLDKQIRKQKIEAIQNQFKQTPESQTEKTLSRSEFHLYATLVPSALLYRVNVRGSKANFLEQQAELDRELLRAMSLLYEIIPLDLIHSLTYEHRELEVDLNQMLEGIMPITEPYDLITYAIREMRGYRVEWQSVEERILVNTERSKRAMVLVSDWLMKGYMFKTLQDHGVDMSDQDITIEDVVLASLKENNRTHKLYRYLTGKLSLQEILDECTQSASSANKFNSYDIKDQLFLFTFLQVENTIIQRFVAFLSHYGTQQENMSLIHMLFSSSAFDPEKWIATYADDPQVNIDRFLLHILNYKGSVDYYSELSEDSYQKIVLGNIEKSLQLYSQLGAEARMSILENIFAKKNELNQEYYYQAIQLGLQDTSKKASSIAQAEFMNIKNKDLYIRIYQTEKKAKLKELALDALRGMENYQSIYQELLSNETSSKFKTLLQNLIDAATQSPDKTLATFGNVVDKRKLARLKWLMIEQLPALLDKEGGELDAEVKEYILTQSVDFMTAPNPLVLKVKDYADSGSLADFAMELYTMWLANQAPAKEKWILFVCTSLGDRRIIDELSRQIKEWAEAGRGALASNAVKALSFMQELAAFVTIDQMKRTVKNRQVKAAATEALAMAAQNLKITPEELEDRLVTTLGFDHRGKRIFSYGQRTFTVKVNNDRQLHVTNDETGKVVKNLPAPAQKDDATLAEQAKLEFAQLKKDVKNLVTIQSLRLEESLSKQRLWSTAAWKNLFVENVMMQKFAIGLIWGVYEEGKLKDTFRYMDDGTFNTVDEEEFECKEEALIGLVHPIELNKEDLQAWKTQLEDYEMKQPFPQLDRQLYFPTEEHLKNNRVSDLPEEEYSPTAFPKNLEKYGWYKGMAQDAGFFYEFYKEYGDMIVELKFSGTSISYYEGMEDISLESLAFYSNKHDRYYYYEKSQPLPISNISPRLFSETIYDIMRATGK